MSRSNDDEVDFFKSLLRFRTVSAEGPSGSYAACVAFLERECKKRLPGAETFVVSAYENKPVLWVTLQGSCPELKAMLLNSHYDVVPAMEEFWDVDPWAAVETAEGRIYGRGTQDMKCVCAQYVLALQRLLAHGQKLKRTIHLSFVPDEEIGGSHVSFRKGYGGSAGLGIRSSYISFVCSLSEGMGVKGWVGKLRYKMLSVANGGISGSVFGCVFGVWV